MLKDKIREIQTAFYKEVTCPSKLPEFRSGYNACLSCKMSKTCELMQNMEQAIITAVKECLPEKKCLARSEVRFMCDTCGARDACEQYKTNLTIDVMREKIGGYDE